MAAHRSAPYGSRSTGSAVDRCSASAGSNSRSSSGTSEPGEVTHALVQQPHERVRPHVDAQRRGGTGRSSAGPIVRAGFRGGLQRQRSPKAKRPQPSLGASALAPANLISLFILYVVWSRRALLVQKSAHCRGLRGDSDPLCKTRARPRGDSLWGPGQGAVEVGGAKRGGH